MRVFYQFAIAEPLGPAVVALDTFDGLHQGQVRLVERAAELAAAADAATVTVVRWPLTPPAAGAAQAVEPSGRLSTLAERLDALARLPQLASAVVWPLADDALPADLGALVEACARWCSLSALVLATDAAGVVRVHPALSPLTSATMVAGVQVVPLADDDIAAAARTALQAGEIADANTLLGHPYTLEGTVVMGDQRGRLLGFPTANVLTDAAKLLPPNGVYAARVRLPGEGTPVHPAVVNIGVRPTFGGGDRQLIEVHLLDAALDLYGQPLALSLIAHLRAEQRFAGVDALKTQIAADAAQARSLLAGLPDE